MHYVIPFKNNNESFFLMGTSRRLKPKSEDDDDDDGPGVVKGEPGQAMTDCKKDEPDSGDEMDDSTLNQEDGDIRDMKYKLEKLRLQLNKTVGKPITVQWFFGGIFTSRSTTTIQTF